MPDPLHKSNRVYAIAAILSPYLIRLIIKKTGMEIHEDLLIIIQSGLIEILSHVVAITLLVWSKAKEKIYGCFQEVPKRTKYDLPG